MGQNVANVEVVTDYTPNKSFLRIHMDLPLTAVHADQIRKLLEQGAFDQAYALVRSAQTDLKNVDMLKAAFDEMAAIRNKNNVTLIQQA